MLPMMEDDKERCRMERIIRDTLRVLCKNGFKFESTINLAATVGITVDNKAVLVVNVAEKITKQATVLRHEEPTPFVSCRNAVLRSESLTQNSNPDETVLQSDSLTQNSNPDEAVLRSESLTQNSNPDNSDAVADDWRTLDAPDHSYTTTIQDEPESPATNDHSTFIEEDMADSVHTKTEYVILESGDIGNALIAEIVQDRNVVSIEHIEVDRDLDGANHQEILGAGSLTDLYHHQALTGKVKKKRACSFCGKLLLVNHVTEHEQLHKGQYRYHCQHCNRGFMSKTLLNCHVSKHEGRKDYSCDCCGKAYRYKHGLKYHYESTACNPHDPV